MSGRQFFTRVELRLRFPGLTVRCRPAAMHTTVREAPRPQHFGIKTFGLGDADAVEIEAENPVVVATDSVVGLGAVLGREAMCSHALHLARPHLPRVFWAGAFRERAECDCRGDLVSPPGAPEVFRHTRDCAGAALARIVDAALGLARP